MRQVSPELAAHRTARKPEQVHHLLWLTAKDRSDGSPQTLGLWTGADAQVITIEGESRTYYGAGGVLSIEDVSGSAEELERTLTITVSSLHAQVVEALRVYDPRLAPMQLHRWVLDPETGLALDVPSREWKGRIMDVDLPLPPPGGTAEAMLRCVGSAWELTKGLSLKRSDAALQAWSPGDMFRQYNTATSMTAWGELMKVTGPAAEPSEPKRSPMSKQRESDRL